MASPIVQQRKLMTRKRIWIAVALTTLVLAFILFSPYGVVTRVSLASECTEIEQQIVLSQTTADSLRNYIKQLQTDTTEMERLARERYGYVRSNEDVYIIR